MCSGMEELSDRLWSPVLRAGAPHPLVTISATILKIVRSPNVSLANAAIQVLTDGVTARTCGNWNRWVSTIGLTSSASLEIGSNSEPEQKQIQAYVPR